MKELYRSSDNFQIIMFKHVLNDHGIQAFVFDEGQRQLYHGLNGIECRLMVIDEDYEEALRILREEKDKLKL